MSSSNVRNVSDTSIKQAYHLQNSHRDESSRLTGTDISIFLYSPKFPSTRYNPIYIQEPMPRSTSLPQIIYSNCVPLIHVGLIANNVATKAYRKWVTRQPNFCVTSLPIINTRIDRRMNALQLCR